VHAQPHSLYFPSRTKLQCTLQLRGQIHSPSFNSMPYVLCDRVGNGISFRKNSSEWFPLFRGRKCSFRGIPRFTEESIPRIETEENVMKKIRLTKNPAPANKIDSMFLSETPNVIPSIFLLCGTVRNGIPRVFSSAEWFRTEFREFASIFVPWYRIPSIFLLCGMVRNGMPRVFCSPEQPEFRRSKPIVPSIRLPRNNFFVGNCKPYSVVSPDIG
jgi:hypothetical protein